MWENRAMRHHLPRVVFGLIFLACLGLDLFAIYYLQEWLGLEPCPMCILQRYAFFAIAALALVGGGTAIRQSWLQHNPPISQSCGSDLEFLLENFPLAQANDALDRLRAGRIRGAAVLVP